MNISMATKVLCQTWFEKQRLQIQKQIATTRIRRKTMNQANNNTRVTMKRNG